MNLNFKAEDFTLVNQGVLVQPGPVKKIRTLQNVPLGKAQDAKGDKETPTLETYEKLPTNTQIGQILKVGADIKDPIYKEGDWIVYNSFRGGQHLKLDLLASKSDDVKCPIMMKSYEILAIVKIEE